MTEIQSLKKLLRVTQLKYDQQRQLFVRIIQEEQALRHELSRLTALKQDNEESAPSLANMRAIGADLLWQGWLARSRSELNMRLARVLAIKEHEQVKVRRAFGKLSALERLIENSERQSRIKMTKARLAQAVDMAVMQTQRGVQ